MEKTPVKRKVVVAIINNMPFIQTPFFESVVELLFTGARKAELAWMNAKAFPVDFARNWAVKRFLGATAYKDMEWMLFLDIDMTFPKDTIDLLFQAAEETGAKVISGTYFKRNFNAETVGWKYGANNNIVEPVLDGTVQEVEIIGMGCALIHRSVLEKIGYPWFRYGSLHENLECIATEDIQFCTRCKDLNIPIMIHTGIICGHLMLIENVQKHIIAKTLCDDDGSGTGVCEADITRLGK